MFTIAPNAGVSLDICEDAMWAMDEMNPGSTL